MTRDELIEALAAIEHERWADWQKWVHAQCAIVESEHTGHIYQGIPIERYNAWQKQIYTPYEQLSHQEQASDIEQVWRYLPLIVEFVSERLDATDLPTSTQWREYMTQGVKSG